MLSLHTPGASTPTAACPCCCSHLLYITSCTQQAPQRLPSGTPCCKQGPAANCLNPVCHTHTQRCTVLTFGSAGPTPSRSSMNFATSARTWGLPRESCGAHVVWHRRDTSTSTADMHTHKGGQVRAQTSPHVEAQGTDKALRHTMRRSCYDASAN